MNKTILFIPSILAILAVSMVLAPTLSHEQQEAKKPKPGEICKVKVNVKATGNVVNGTEYTANLGGLTQTKIADEVGSISFNFNFGKSVKVQDVKPSGTGTCPADGSILAGDVNGNPFEVTVKKNTKVSVVIP